MGPRSRPLALLAALVASGLAFLVAAQTAVAHVTVSSTDAVQGGFAVITFRVPTESATASTTKLTVALPTDHPIASVAIQPQPGWSFTTKMTKLHPPVQTDDGKVTEAVSQITWTADSAAAAIKPGEFNQFDLSAGPLPKVDALTFRVIQAYSDGAVDKWIEVLAPGSTAEPEHPAPTLTLARATDTAPRGTDRSSTGADSDKASKGAATIGIVLGVIGVVLGASGLALALRRRRTAD